MVGKGTATDLADQDRIVISDGNTTVAKSDGSTVKEEVKVPESTEKKGTVAIDAVTKEEVSGEIPEETAPDETTEAEEEVPSEAESKTDSKTDTKKIPKRNPRRTQRMRKRYFKKDTKR